MQPPFEKGPPLPRRSVEQHIIGLIEEQSGRITFAQFMAHALYAQPSPQKEGGFYTSGRVKIGPGGDFVTSPELFSPEYGHGVARILAGMWEEMGRPAPFTVVEMGGGNGVLARDILGAIRAGNPAFYQAISYLSVEISPALVARQRENLRGLPAQIILGSAYALPLRGIRGCFISNELVDSLPFHRVLFGPGELRELYIGYEDNSFFETDGPLSNPALADYVSRFELEVEAGRELGVSLNALSWLEGVAQALRMGFIITIDYGFADPTALKEQGAPPRFFGPRHQIGAFDITADVDFHALRLHGELLGLNTRELADEVDWTATFGHFPLGMRGSSIRARYVLVQEKR